MRAAYAAQDRADINVATKELARKMQKPNAHDWRALKRLGRYLKGRPRAVMIYRRQRMPKTLHIVVDSDHAGCLRTRKSTTGMCVDFGRHTVKSHSGIQSTIALSSAESETYALVKGAAMGLSVQSLLWDWNIEVRVKLHSDSSSAIAFGQRRGLGKQRHVQTRYLWIQERIAMIVE